MHVRLQIIVYMLVTYYFVLLFIQFKVIWRHKINLKMVYVLVPAGFIIVHLLHGLPFKFYVSVQLYWHKSFQKQYCQSTKIQSLFLHVCTFEWSSVPRMSRSFTVSEVVACRYIQSSRVFPVSA